MGVGGSVGARERRERSREEGRLERVGGRWRTLTLTVGVGVGVGVVVGVRAGVGVGVGVGMGMGVGVESLPCVLRAACGWAWEGREAVGGRGR